MIHKKQCESCLGNQMIRKDNNGENKWQKETETERDCSADGDVDWGVPSSCQREGQVHVRRDADDATNYIF